MQEAVKIISENGIWVFLIGILTSIIIGAVKTPIRAKYVDSVKDLVEKQKRENLFDTTVFLSTYVVAFIAAAIYYPISYKVFYLDKVLQTSLSIWLSQSLAYGAWKKLGLKRALCLLSKLVFKDLNQDGEISLDEAISQVVKGVKEGRVGADDLIYTVNENLPEVVEEMSKASEGTEEAEKVNELLNNRAEGLAESMKSEVIDKVTKLGRRVIGKTPDGTEVVVKSDASIRF